MNRLKAVVRCGSGLGVLFLAGALGAQNAPQAARAETTVPQGQRPQGPQRAPAAASAPAAAPDENAAPKYHEPAPEEKTVVTHHSARIGGKTINYTATVGTYVVRADNGAPKAAQARRRCLRTWVLAQSVSS
jgi:carboxypeptidase C (cathepsin A)